MNTKTILLVLLAVLLLAGGALYLYADTITLSLPPWNTCGFRQTKAGNSFICIGYDVDTWILKR